MVSRYRCQYLIKDITASNESSRHLDTPGIFARDFNVLIKAHQAWTPFIPGSLSLRPALVRLDCIANFLIDIILMFIQKPKRILFPYKSFSHQNRDVEDIVDKFLSILEAYLGVKRDLVDMEAEWAVSNPVGTTEPLTEYFEKVNRSS